MAGENLLTTAMGSTGGTIDFTNPDWYNQYMQSVAGLGNNLASGPNVPGSIASNTANWYSQPLTGNFNPNLQGAYDTAETAGQPGGYIANGIGGLNAASNVVTGAAGNLTANIGGLNQVSNNLDAVSSTIPGITTHDSAKLQEFMNPYTRDAANATADLSNRNLFENIIPNINSTFVGAGQFGSTRNADFMNRGIRDQQQTLTNSLGTLNYGAAKTAGDQYSDWVKNMLQGTQIQGQLGSEQIDAGNAITSASGALTTAGNSLAGNAKSLVDMGNTDLANKMATGKSLLDFQNAGLDASYKDYINQIKYPLDATGALSQITGSLKGSINSSQSLTPGSMTPAQKAAMLSSMAGTLGKGSTLDDLSALWKKIFGEGSSGGGSGAMGYTGGSGGLGMSSYNDYSSI